ncbi:MAG: hypothetical protein ACP5UB_11165 [Candidatus Sumerlaeaceae bacterium]
MLDEHGVDLIIGQTWRRRERPRPLPFRRLVVALVLWLVLIALGTLHVSIRFLVQDVQLERQLLLKRQEELLKRQMELESKLAMLKRQVDEEREEICAELGLVEVDSSRRVEARLPRELVAKYLPARPVRGGESRSAFVSTAQAGQLEMPQLFHALVTVIEANRAQAKTLER